MSIRNEWTGSQTCATPDNAQKGIDRNRVKSERKTAATTVGDEVSQVALSSGSRMGAGVFFSWWFPSPMGSALSLLASAAWADVTPGPKASHIPGPLPLRKYE